MITFDCKRIKWRRGEVQRGAERSTKKDLCIKYFIQCPGAVSEHEDLILNGSCTDMLSQVISGAFVKLRVEF